MIRLIIKSDHSNNDRLVNVRRTALLTLKIVRFHDIWTKRPLTRLYAQKLSIGPIGAALQKEIDKMQRIRPSSQPPKVWQVIEKTNKDGKTMKFTIQEIPEDRYEDAVEHMCTFFLADEPTCQCLGKFHRLFENVKLF